MIKLNVRKKNTTQLFVLLNNILFYMMFDGQ